MLRVLDRLRSATRDAHASIETTPAFARLLSPDLEVEEYVRTLRRLAAFHGAFAARLELPLRCCPPALALLDGERLRAIEADLKWFGTAPLAPPALDVAADCLSAALGALYVIEGSSLGGHVIGRNVANALGVRAGAGGSFHCGAAPSEIGQRWKAVQEILGREIDEAGLPWEPATKAAQETFRILDEWMRN